MPTTSSQHTNPEIALSLLEQARDWGVPVRLVVADSGSGDHPHFLHGLATRQGPSICAVESPCGVRVPEEGPAAARQVPAYQGVGQPPKPRPAPLYTVKQLIAALPPSAWRISSWREGTKGTMQAEASRAAGPLGQRRSPAQHQP